MNVNCQNNRGRSNNRIVGGTWWQPLLNQQPNFAQQVTSLADALKLKLKERFNEVCHHAVKALPHHQISKYFLIFGSRHPAALRLMNDEMAKSRKALADLAAPAEPMLFELRPEELVPDIGRVPDLIRRHATSRIARGELIIRVIRDAFCEYSSPEIRGCIEQLLKAGILISETGKGRINDDVKVWLA